MSIQITKQPESVSFSGDPIVVQVRSSLTGKTFLRVRAVCKVSVTGNMQLVSYSEEYSCDVATDGTAVFNVGHTVKTALRKYMKWSVSGKTVTQSVYKAQFTVSFREVYLQDMQEVVGDEVVSDTAVAIPGALSEFERMNPVYTGTVDLLGSGRILSRKPDGERIPEGTDLYIPAVNVGGTSLSYYWEQNGKKTERSMETGGVLVPASAVINSDGIQEGAFTVGIAQGDVSRKYRVPGTKNARNFLFVNGFGLIESVSAFSLEKKSYETESELYVIPSEVNAGYRSNVVSMAKNPYASLELSSGFVDREWTDWWINEFLVSEMVWMQQGDVFLPVAVVPAETSVLYDRNEPGLSSVEFTVRFSFSGSTSAIFVR